MDRVNVIPAIVMGATIVLAGCDDASLFGPEFQQGIEGIALIGPQCPVQSQDNPCPDLPHEARIDVVDADGGLVVSLRSDSTGSFRVGLPPAVYVLSPEGGDPFPAVGEQTVVVRRDEYAEVVIRFDTGIR